MDNLFGLLLLLIVVWICHNHFVKKKRIKFIEEYRFPMRVYDKVLSTYPHLSESDVQKVIKALKDYFVICNDTNLSMTSMPSQVVDVAWHEFILFTREYHEFCNNSFGKYLHHKPAEAMQSPAVAQEGIKRAWRFSCIREGINPKTAHKLPLLFSIDADLDIRDGFKYVLNCDDLKTDTETSEAVAFVGEYCAGNIACGGGCGGAGCGGGCGG